MTSDADNAKLGAPAHQEQVDLQKTEGVAEAVPPERDAADLHDDGIDLMDDRGQQHDAIVGLEVRVCHTSCAAIR